MRHLALSDPLLVAGGIISAVSSSTVGHAEKQAFSDYQPSAHDSVSDTHTTSPLPQKDGKELHPPFHVKPWELQSFPSMPGSTGHSCQRCVRS